MGVKHPGIETGAPSGVQGMQTGQGSRGMESSLPGEMSSVTFLAELAESEPRANQGTARDVHLQ